MMEYALPRGGGGPNVQLLIMAAVVAITILKSLK